MKKLGYKLYHNSLPSNLLHELRTDYEGRTLAKQHCYNTRNKKVLNLPRFNKKIYKNSFLVQSIKKFSELPTEDKPANYQQPSAFDALDLELDWSSVVETPLMNFDTDTNAAVDSLLAECPDLTGGPAYDVEMGDDTTPLPPVVAQLPGQATARFEQEIADYASYRHNLMETEGEGEMTEVPASPVTPQEDELLDLETGLDSALAKVVGTRRPKSTTPKKKFKGQEDPYGTPTNFE